MTRWQVFWQLITTGSKGGLEGMLAVVGTARAAGIWEWVQRLNAVCNGACFFVMAAAFMEWDGLYGGRQ
jgi:hypothetical protein